MPYDPRPLSEGGNRGIDEPNEVGGFSRKAPKGKFRVVSVDTFDGGDWVDGDHKTLALARKSIEDQTRGKQMLIMHIYNDKGEHMGKEGTF